MLSSIPIQVLMQLMVTLFPSTVFIIFLNFSIYLTKIGLQVLVI